MKSTILWGATGQAKVLAEFLPALGHGVIALFDNDPDVASPLPGIPLFHGWAGFEKWRASHPGAASCLVAIGGGRGADRLQIQRRLAAAGLEPITAVHPRAFVAASATVGAGSQILASASVCVEARLGQACIINTAASIDHECVLGDGVHIGPGATLAGCVHVGDRTFIGAGATVLPRIRVGADCIIGAGSVVTRDVPDGKVAYGHPCRIHRDNDIHLESAP
jgi:sugar O-acyltransferase (sialic acid O-acetyltransferase NeuD family)